MAIKGVTYRPSAVSLLTGMIGDAHRATTQRLHDDIIGGVKGIAEAGGSVYSNVKRRRAVEYVGDNRLHEMEAELEGLKSELSTVQNQMRTIKAEDKGSLDYFMDEPTEPSFQDVDSYEVDGGRFAGNRNAEVMPELRKDYLKYGATAFGGVL